MAEKNMVDVTVKRTVEVGGKVFFPGRIQTDEATAAGIQAEQERRVRAAQTQAGASDEPTGQDGIPEDFPHGKVLEENGVTTLSQLRELDEEGLKDLKGIGDAKAQEILEALEALEQEE